MPDWAFMSAKQRSLGLTKAMEATRRGPDGPRLTVFPGHPDSLLTPP